MFCSTCGAQLPDNTPVCPYCGTQLGAQQPYPQQGYQQTYQQPNQQQYQQNYQQSYPQQGYQQPYQQPYAQRSYPQNPALPMNWHKFLVYFALWAGAVLNVIYGIITLTGGQYGIYKELVYAVIPGLKAPDIIYGISLIGLGGFGFYVAASMLKFKKGAPKLLQYLYIAAAALSVLYVIIAVIILSKYSGDLGSVIASVAVTLVIAVVMVIVNNIYYKKREHLFVN